ncbi:response regulator [Dyadobacter sp. CY261]|uniref:response regulator n=1 Tax=Dyadobacter sp. CY261 TaxID=2907203 RepID=UPI001F313EFE|nr:response regulator [Dyadobacter sp. CY261]MCF0073008.1 response regulator [Dyadobacter sp. CY261]
MAVNGPIILVDDDEDDVFLIKTALEELSISNEVRVFRHGLDALHYFQQLPANPFVVISDLNMPVMNGLELLDALTQQKLLPSGFPFVFLTTSDVSAIPKQVLTEGRFSFFTKGYSYEQILETMSMVIERGR